MANSVKPEANNDYFTFSEDESIGGNLLANDAGGVGGNKFLRFFDQVSVGAKKAGQITDIPGEYGTFHVKADGSFTYTLYDSVKQGLFAGTTLTEKLQYKVSDGSGNTDVAWFSMDIKGETVKPVAVNDDFTFAESAAMGGNLLANDIAGETGKMFLRSIAGTSIDAKTDGVTDVAGQYGTFHFKADGTFTYDLNADVKASLRDGQTVTETMKYYKISDGSGNTDAATLTLTVKGETAGPIAVNDEFTFTEGAAISGNVLANDAVGDLGKMVVRSIAGVTLGTKDGQITDIDGEFGTFHFKADGTFTYDLDADVKAGMRGGDTVVETLRYYKISDGSGHTDSAKLTLTINGVTDGPIAVNDEFTFGENAAIAGNVLANDSVGDLGKMIVRSIAGVTLGTKDGQITDIDGEYGTFHFKTDGTFTYDLDADVKAGMRDGDTLVETLRYYKISDGSGHTDSAKLTLTINGETDAPIAVNDEYAFGASDTILGNVLDNDIPGDLDKMFVRSIAGVTLGTKDGQITDIDGEFGTFHFKADGSFTYDLDDAFEASLGVGETLVETLRYYKISDGSGHTDSAKLTLTIAGDVGDFVLL